MIYAIAVSFSYSMFLFWLAGMEIGRNPKCAFALVISTLAGMLGAVLYQGYKYIVCEEQGQ